MSLQIWLPLNGDLYNQGLLNFNYIIDTNPTFVESGKIGKAMSMGQITMSADNMQSIFSNNTFSLCFWVYINADTGDTSKRSMFFGNNSPRRYSIFQYPSCNDLHWSWANDTTNNISGVYNNAFPSYQWTHCAITYDSYNLKIYLNGILVRTQQFSYAPISLNYNTVLFGNCANSGKYLNDYRIYDHALSAKEVEEIAKGLVLHYKLDSDNNGGFGWLLPNTERTITRASSNSFIDYDYNNTLINSSETNFIVDFDAKGSVANMGLDLYFRNGSGSAYAVTSKQILSTNWTHYSLSLSGSPANLNLFRARCYSGTAGDIITLRNVKLLSNNMPINENIIYDSSGYNNNGINVDGTVNFNTSRYNFCTSLAGTTVDNSSNTLTGAKYFYTPLNLSAMSALTVTWWAKVNQYGRGGILETVGSSGLPLGHDYNTTAISNWDNTFRLYNGSTAFEFLGYFQRDSNWHYRTIVFNGTNAYYYEDCILKKSAALSGTLPAITGFRVGLGRAGGVSRQIDQQVSDLRIYTTALNLNQIQELYNTSMTIDNNGNIYARELVE